MLQQGMTELQWMIDLGMRIEELDTMMKELEGLEEKGSSTLKEEMEVVKVESK